LLQGKVNCDWRKVIGEGKVNGKVKFTLEEATKIQRGSRGIDLLFL
jgi:hypothetical protein